MKFVFAALLLVTSLSVLAQTSLPQPRVPDTKMCAMAFNSLDRDYTSKLTIKSGESMNNLNQIALNNSRGDWDNKISKVIVNKGCTFIGYQYQDFNRDYNSHRPLNGFAQVLENSTHRDLKVFIMGQHYDNKISSLKCFCL